MKVTGLVLTVGEPTMKAAIESLRLQTVPCDEIVVVRGITPFHRAMNEGISRIRTEFFVQCDADMVLDPDCVEMMLRFQHDEDAVWIGYLSDELLGTVQAVKMFRTSCVREQPFSDHISSDTQLINRLVDRGWKYRFVRRDRPRFGHAPEVLGAHRPSYTPLYTFEKFRLEGARVAYRGVFDEFDACLTKLAQGDHPMARIALIGFCYGLLSRRIDDGLRPCTRSPEFELLEKLLSSRDEKGLPFAITKEHLGDM